MNRVKIDSLQALKVLDGQIGDLYCEPHAEENSDREFTLSQMRSFLKQNIPLFKANVFAMSKPFLEALGDSLPALNKSMDKDVDFMYSNLKYEAGTYINQKEVTFYKINKEAQTITAVIIIDGEIVYGGLNIGVGEKSKDSRFFIPRFVLFGKNIVEREEILTITLRKALVPLAIALFRTYSDHEMKIISGNDYGTLNGITYKNGNRRSITILDSSWYTSIVRTEGFMVTGHLRMQPCGAGNTQRKLIYVDSFMKHGYVRKAKMLEEAA